MISHETIINSLKILFNQDEYEEIIYPIIKAYFRFATDDGSQSFDDYDIKELQRAFNILGINESAKDLYG